MFSNPSIASIDQAGKPTAERVSHFLRWLSILIASTTIAMTPWFLGGAIPHARLCLQVGIMAASVPAFLSLLLDRRNRAGFPALCLPILGLALIGAIQLQPRFPHVATMMKHAIVPNAAEFLPTHLSEPVHPRTPSASETRRTVSQLLSLTLLVLVIHESVRTSRQLAAAISLLTVSGVAMAALALSQQFGSADVVVGNHWKISNSTPFGCFVNPNNAAGWLSICLAGSLFLCGAASFRPDESNSTIRQSARWMSASERLWLWWVDLVGTMSSMSPLQVLALSGTIVLIAAIGATLSRAGIVAGCLGLVVFALTRFRSGYWTTTILLMTAVAILAGSLMLLFDLDTLVLSELQTLKDPVSESTGRLLHWSDSLQACLDFPVLGSGLGAYRFSTLPYQQHFTGKWFQRADNQYVELIVESGILGIACLTLLILLTLQMIIRQFRTEAHQKRTPALYFRRWLGSSCACAMVALAGASFFDYGIALPSVSGAAVLLFSCLAASDSPGFSSVGPAKSLASTSAANSFLSVLPRMVVWIAVAGFSARLLPDAFGSVSAYEPIPDVERLLHRPAMASLTDSGDELLAKLESHIETQHDDPEYQRLWILMRAQLHQRDLVRQIAKQQNKPLTLDQQTNLLNRVTPAALLLQLEAPNVPDEVRRQSIADIQQSLKQYDWLDVAQQTLHRHPLTLSIAPNVCLYGLLMQDKSIAQEFSELARFSEPHSSQNLFVLGYFLTRAGYAEKGNELWRQALMASETVRPSILLEIARTDGIEVALKKFAPETWESAARAALQTGADRNLQQRLFVLAESLWRNNRKMTVTQILLRSNQLNSMNQPEVAVEYLNEQLASDPTNIEIRKSLARLLETLGENEQAYNEWLRIKSFAGESDEVKKALERTIRLPPKPLGRSRTPDQFPN